jgi:signal transduction histidine kinase
MLRNNFRTKLLAILAVPVAALIGITAFAGYDRLSESRDANKLRHRIDVISAGAEVAHQVQLEQAASADVVANPTGSRDPLAAQRAATDDAVSAYRRAVDGAGDISSPAYDTGLDRVRRNLNALATSYRGSVDLGSDINSVTSAYSEIGSSLSDLVGVVADEAHDPSLAKEASALAALSHAKDATAKEWAVLEVSLSRGAFKDAEQGTFKSAVTESDRWLGIHDGLATPSSRSNMQTKMSGSAIAVSDRIEKVGLDAPTATSPVIADPSRAPAAGAAQWHDAMSGRLDIQRQVLSSDIGNLAAHASTVQAAANKDLQTFLLIAIGAVLASALLGLVMARAVSTPLHELTAAADRLAEEQLPALVNGLRNPGDDAESVAATITPIEVKSSDEIGQLAQAFNTVQNVAVNVAAEQSEMLRKGISEIFVTLARRNQVLIDRQIEFLDELEATEDDPDQLAQLYRLDHLATRMRRNAESLLVLSGSEPARSRTRPVALFDVVRAAIGEVEDFSRVDLHAFDDVDVTGNSAVDLGHLLAELMDNAAHFSPPDTRVTVEGRRGHAGYVISIRDSGIGMNDEQLAEANELLASPPPVGLALSRSLGFTVVARLAARYGVSVRLLPGEKVGTSAIVHLPQTLIIVPQDAIASDVTASTPDVDSYEVYEEWAPDGAAEPAPEPVSEPVPEPAAMPWNVTAKSEPDEDEFESLLRTAWGEESPEHEEPEPEPEPEPATPVVDEAEHDERSWAPPAWPEPAPAEPEDAPVQSLAWAPLPKREPQPEPVPESESESESEPEPHIEPAVAAADPFGHSPSSLQEAVPQGQSFERGLFDLVEGESALGPAGLIEPPIDAVPPVPVAPPPVPATPAPAHPAGTDHVREDSRPASNSSSVTASGLTRRVPRRDTEYEGIERYHSSSAGPNVLATKRSPDDVRAMLARYRGGLQRGRSGDEPTNSESGSER